MLSSCILSLHNLLKRQCSSHSMRTSPTYSWTEFEDATSILANKEAVITKLKQIQGLILTLESRLKMADYNSFLIQFLLMNGAQRTVLRQLVDYSIRYTVQLKIIVSY